MRAQGAVCFLVTTREATNVEFSISPALEAHIDARTLRASISSVPVPEGLTHQIVKYELSAVRGFPQFQKRRDLEVCFDTVPQGAGKRCVQLYFLVPPFDLRVSVDEGPFRTRAVADSKPYERRRVRVRVRDLNIEDDVCIDYPAVTQGEVSNVPNAVDQDVLDTSTTAYFEWEETGDCYAATHCVSGLVGGVCTGGEWERVFTIKSKTQNATIVFGAHALSRHVRSRSPLADGMEPPDQSADSAQLIVASRGGVPAFLDAMNLAIDNDLMRGTPYSLQHLEPAFINCPLRPVAIYAILQKWSNETGQSNTQLGTEPVEIVPHGQMPSGIVLTKSTVDARGDAPRDSGGNFKLLGSVSVVQVDWTPTRGHEGACTHTHAHTHLLEDMRVRARTHTHTHTHTHAHTYTPTHTYSRT